MQERTLEQERKGLEQGVNDYLCLSAAKKLSKTITFSDKKWSNDMCPIFWGWVGRLKLSKMSQIVMT